MLDLFFFNKIDYSTGNCFPKIWYSKLISRIIITCKQSFPYLKAVSLHGLVLLPYQLLKTLCELRNNPLGLTYPHLLLEEQHLYTQGCLGLFLNTIIDMFNPPLFLERMKLKCIVIFVNVLFHFVFITRLPQTTDVILTTWSYLQGLIDMFNEL